jgi:hypothetical protein
VGIRETLNQNPGITTGATIGIIVIAIGFIVWQLIPSRPSIPTKAYYTTDDSSPEAAKAALFVDEIDKIAPFDKGGKQAYRANVFSCDGGKTKWVGWIEKYNAQAKQKIEAQMASTEPDNIIMDDARMTGMEVKRPGDKAWIKYNDQTRYQKVMEVTCPDGKVQGIEMQMP